MVTSITGRLKELETIRERTKVYPRWLATPNPEMMEQTRTPLLIRLFAVNIWLVLFLVVVTLGVTGCPVLTSLS